jgi:hypothetical protein
MRLPNQLTVGQDKQAIHKNEIKNEIGDIKTAQRKFEGTISDTLVRVAKDVIAVVQQKA